MLPFEACQRTKECPSFSRRRRGAVLVERFGRNFPSNVIMPKKRCSSFLLVVSGMSVIAFIFLASCWISCVRVMSIDTWLDSVLILIAWRLAELQLFFFPTVQVYLPRWWCHPVHSDILLWTQCSQLCSDTPHWHCESHMECVEIWNGHREN